MSNMSKSEQEAAMKMIEICPSAILTVEDQDLEMQRLAVSKDPSLIERIEPINSSVVETAVKREGRYLRYITCFDEDICLAAVENDGDALKYVPVIFQTTKVVNAAVKNNPRAVLEAYSPSQESLNLAVKEDPRLIYVFDKSWNTAETLKSAVDACATSGRCIDSIHSGLAKLSQLSPSEIMWISDGLDELDSLRTIEFITSSILETKSKEEEAARLAAEEDSFY